MKKLLLFSLAVVLVSLGCTKIEEPKEKAEVLITPPAVEVTVSPTTEKPAAPEAIKNGILYENGTYNFSLVLPQTWKNYNWHRKSKTLDDKTSMLYIDFGFAAQENLFTIGIYTKEQWAKIGEGPITKLGETADNVIAYWTAQDSINEELAARMREVPSIIASFKME